MRNALVTLPKLKWIPDLTSRCNIGNLLLRPCVCELNLQKFKYRYLFCIHFALMEDRYGKLTKDVVADHYSCYCR